MTAGIWKRLFRLTESTRQVADQVEDELHSHLEELVTRNLARGMSEEEARAAALTRFHDLDATRAALVRGRRESVHRSRRRFSLDAWRCDLRLSLRQLRRRPGFSALVLFTLGVGIGAGATLYSIVDHVLLQPLPYPESGSLVFVGATSRGSIKPSGSTLLEFLTLREEGKAFEGLAVSRYTALDISADDQPVRYTAACVTADYFRLLGGVPELGRLFSAEDFEAGPARVVILSHRAWREHWGGDPDVIGTSFIAGDQRVEGRAVYTIAGVMPPGFRHPKALEYPLSRLPDSELWLPLTIERPTSANSLSNWSLRMIGRLSPDRSLEEVRAEVATVAAELAADHPRYYDIPARRGRSLGVISLLEMTVGDRRRDLLILFGATGLLLLIAIANVTGLLLARALDRTGEFAVCSALGAGRGGLFRRLVTESVTLALLGGLVGLVMAGLGIQLFREFAPADLPRLGSVSLDLRVILFAVGVALLVGLVIGLVTALLNAGADAGRHLPGRSAGGDARSITRLRGILLSIQLTLATTLLIGAGLLVNSLQRLQSVEVGLDRTNLVMMPVRLPLAYDTDRERVEFYAGLEQRLRSLPGVRSASWTTDPPMGILYWEPQVRFDGASAEDDPVAIQAHLVGPDYFETMGIPLRSGRGLLEGDDPMGERVVVVDELAAATYWPGADPIGQRLTPSVPERDDWHVVVGVVGNVRQQDLADDHRPTIYFSYLQRPQVESWCTMVLRTGRPLDEIAPLMRAAVWDLDPDLPIPAIERMEVRIATMLQIPRFRTLLLSAFALSALVVTVTGIYGLMLYLVTGRIREIGIRMALGARSGHVLWAVSRSCLLLLGIGLCSGLVATLLTVRLLSRVLFDVSPLDPLTYLVMTSVLGFTALVACLVPARRAVGLDPTTALRRE